MKALVLGALALLGWAAMMPSASAAEATTSVNVRSGPGTQYRVVGTLHRGENVNVRRCQSNGWCQVARRAGDGWVSARFLVSNGFRDDFLRDRRVRPNLSFSIIIGGGLPGFPGFPGGGGSHDGGGGQRDELVCLVTFFKASDVAGGADADVESARVMPRREAERLVRPNGRNAIFDYGADRQTIDTCNYLNRLNR